MTERTITITNAVGLHSMTASNFIKTAEKYKDTTRIFITKGNRRTNAQSLLGVLALGVYKNDVITISAEGKDEVEAVEAAVVEAEAEIPLAMAQALRDGKLGVMDYYNMLNVQADTEMRKSIGQVSDDKGKNAETR